MVVSMIASLVVAGIVRVLSEIGVSQTAGSMANSAYTWLVTLNPILLIILGIIVFIAGKLAKWIGIVMVIIGVILLALPFVMHLI
jgi:uncharacterized membrane protein HdeD (DUF308 family)